MSAHLYLTVFMKKRLFTTLIVALALPLTALAQGLFGYLSYSETMQALPDYAIIQREIDNLQWQYSQEMKRVEDEFNKKYEEFIEQQSELATPIRMKRQAELQEMMEKNIAFKEESRQQLAKAEAEAMAPLKVRLSEAIAKIAAERGLALVVNTDSNACPFINPEMGEDINELVIAQLAK